MTPNWITGSFRYKTKSYNCVWKYKHSNWKNNAIFTKSEEEVHKKLRFLVVLQDLAKEWDDKLEDGRDDDCIGNSGCSQFSFLSQPGGGRYYKSDTWPKLAPLGKREVGSDIHEGWKKSKEERIEEFCVTYEVDHPLMETVTWHDLLCSSNRQFVAYLWVFTPHKMLKSAKDFVKSLAPRD